VTVNRLGYVQIATLAVDSTFDQRAPGGAVTVALCGSIEHDPPCPVAPHQTRITVDGARANVRVVFACDPAVEKEMRSRIDASLAAGRFLGPDGVTTSWRLLESRPARLDASERPLAKRLETF
jgi:hypothetical protein